MNLTIGPQRLLLVYMEDIGHKMRAIVLVTFGFAGKYASKIYNRGYYFVSEIDKYVARMLGTPHGVFQPMNTHLGMVSKVATSVLGIHTISGSTSIIGHGFPFVSEVFFFQESDE